MGRDVAAGPSTLEPHFFSGRCPPTGSDLLLCGTDEGARRAFREAYSGCSKCLFAGYRPYPVGPRSSATQSAMVEPDC